MDSKSDKIKAFADRGVKILDNPPEGWKLLENTNTEPNEYRWWSNGKSLFGGQYEHALVRVKEKGSR